MMLAEGEWHIGGLLAQAAKNTACKKQHSRGAHQSWVLSDQSIVETRTTHDRLNMFIFCLSGRDLLLCVSVCPHAQVFGMAYG